MDQPYYRTGQFAKLASVTIRTLRYYDKVGLLSPTQHTDAGYRLYSEKDLLTLQQILTLKFLGFSLEEIKKYLHAGSQQFHKELACQKQMMYEKRTQLDTIIQVIEKAEQQISTEQHNITAIIGVIQALQVEQKKEWVRKYFTEEQLNTINQLSAQSFSPEAAQQFANRPEWTEEDQKRVDQQYAYLKSELTRLVANGSHPASPEAQSLAKLKTDLLVGFTQGHPAVEAGVCTWWEGFNKLPEDQRPFDINLYIYNEEETAFLNKAIEIYKQQ